MYIYCCRCRLQKNSRAVIFGSAFDIWPLLVSICSSAYHIFMLLHQTVGFQAIASAAQCLKMMLPPPEVPGDDAPLHTLQHCHAITTACISCRARRADARGLSWGSPSEILVCGARLACPCDGGPPAVPGQDWGTASAGREGWHMGGKLGKGGRFTLCRE